MKISSRGLILFAGLLFFWQLCVHVFHFPTYILPSPVDVAHALRSNAGLILQNIIPTLAEAIIGFCCSFLLGTLGALTIIYFRPAQLWFLPILIISQALPTFAVAPLLIAWLGYGMLSKIAITILMLFFPITSAFYDGLTKTPRDYLDLAKTMNGTRFRILCKLQIPAALPSLATGLRMATVYAMMGAIVGEWVGSSQGLGFLMLNANSQMQISLVFAVLFVVCFFTLAFYFLMSRLLNHFIFW